MSHPTEDDARLREERHVAHAGGLARFIGMCAHHPWRVIGAWLATTVALIVLVAAQHGTLVNEFKVPGTDFQKATDLIEAKFPQQQGAALRVVAAAPAGDTLATPEREQALAKMLQLSVAGQKALDEDQANVGEITNPLQSTQGQLSKDGRVAFYDVQFDRTGFELPRAKV